MLNAVIKAFIYFCGYLAYGTDRIEGTDEVFANLKTIFKQQVGLKKPRTAIVSYIVNIFICETRL